MKIEYRATAEDIAALYSYLWRNSAYFRRRIGVGTLVVAAWILVSAYLSQGELSLRDAFIALNVAIAFPVLTPLLAMLRTKKGSRILTIDPHGIHTQLGKQKGEVRWENIAELFVTTEHVFILGRNLNSFTIPNRAFQDDSQRNEFIRLCEDYANQRRSLRNRPEFALWILGFGLAFLLIFTPYLYQTGWRLRHGNAIAYQEKHVPVPRGWIASAKPRELTITKMPLTFFAFFRLGWMAQRISIRKVSRGSRPVPETGESFEKSFWTYPPTPANSAVISGPLKIGTPPNDIFCMTATPANNDAPVVVECLLQQGTWEASFLGARQNVERFFEILRGIN